MVLLSAAFSSLGVGVISEKSGAKDTCADHKNEVSRHAVSFLAARSAIPVNASQMSKPETRIRKENGRPLMNCPKTNAAAPKFANADD
jgi:hypothetical protein